MLSFTSTRPSRLEVCLSFFLFFFFFFFYRLRQKHIPETFNKLVVLVVGPFNVTCNWIQPNPYMYVRRHVLTGIRDTDENFTLCSPSPAVRVHVKQPCRLKVCLSLFPFFFFFFFFYRLRQKHILETFNKLVVLAVGPFTVPCNWRVVKISSTVKSCHNCSISHFSLV